MLLRKTDYLHLFLTAVIWRIWLHMSLLQKTRTTLVILKFSRITTKCWLITHPVVWALTIVFVRLIKNRLAHHLHVLKDIIIFICRDLRTAVYDVYNLCYSLIIIHLTYIFIIFTLYNAMKWRLHFH